MRDKFWMVYLEDGRGPSVRHATRKNAVAEAERLCRKEGLPVYLLKATHVCRVVPPPVPPTEWEALGTPVAPE